MSLASQASILTLASGVRLPALIFCLSVFGGGTVHGQCRYDVTDVVPSPPCGLFNLDVFALDLNEEKHVVGVADCLGANQRGFIWRGGSLEFRENTAVIAAVNGVGTFVGTINDDPPPETPDRAAFSETSDGVLRFFGTIPSGDFSEANDIAPNGLVIGEWGHSRGANGVPRAASFLALPDGSTTGIAEDLPLSSAEHVNSNGRVIGQILGVSPLTVFEWEDGITVRIPVPKDAIGLGTSDLNENGEYLLRAPTSDFDAPLGFFVQETLLTTIKPVDGYAGTTPRGLNNVRQIVGTLRGDLAPTGFLWQEGTTYKLSDLVDLPPGLELRSARAINERGVILAQGSVSSGFFLLEPRDVPLADVNIDCAVGQADLLYIIEHWGGGDLNADIDESGRVGFGDLVMLLSHWGNSSQI